MAFDDLLPFLQSQRRGFNFRYSGEDPKILSLVLYGQKKVLRQLLHPNVLSRMSNSSFYGNSYDVSVFLKDLPNAIFLSDISKSVSVTRMNLQVEYVESLTSILSKSNYDNLSKSAVFNNLIWLEKNLNIRSGNKKSIEHRKYLFHLIESIKNYN